METWEALEAPLRKAAGEIGARLGAPCAGVVLGSGFGPFTDALGTPAELVARARMQPESLLARVRADKLTSALGYEETVETLRAQLRPGELVASESYSLVHMLAFVSGGTLPAHLAQVNRGSHGLSALYWHPPEYFEGRDLVYVTGRERTLAALEDMCEAVQPLEPVRMYRDDVLVREIYLARCIGAHPGPGVMSRLP